MRLNNFKWYLFLFGLIVLSTITFGQNVPLGIFYQAVARDNFGKELASRDIDVKFSILSDNPVGPVSYQEVHSHVTTSKYGVFSLIIGKGTPSGGAYGELSQVQWSKSYHYLKVEVKFDNAYIDMGTMQFLAVPYALYAQKSLEPGPAGPKGDPGPKGEQGDPSSDNQNLSFDQTNLSISGGNSVPLSSLLQTLTITNSPEGNYLGISRGNSVLLSNFEGDGDPANELQDITINSNKLKITKNPLATEWDLAPYLDNTDAQALSYNATTRVLGISGSAATVDLSELKNDADASVTNEIQNLSFDPATNNLSISGGNSVSLGNIVAFRAKKSVATSAPMPLSNIDFIPDEMEYNDGLNFDAATGEFSAPSTGIYTFDIKYIAPSSGDGIKIMLYKNGNLYEYLGTGIGSSTTLFRTLTIRLVANNRIKFVIHTGTGVEIGTGSFSGFKVN